MNCEELHKLNCSQLRKECKRLKLRGYGKAKKNDLVLMILERTKHERENIKLKKQIEKLKKENKELKKAQKELYIPQEINNIILEHSKQEYYIENQELKKRIEYLNDTIESYEITEMDDIQTIQELRKEINLLSGTDTYSEYEEEEKDIDIPPEMKRQIEACIQPKKELYIPPEIQNIIDEYLNQLYFSESREKMSKIITFFKLPEFRWDNRRIGGKMDVYFIEQHSPNPEHIVYNNHIWTGVFQCGDCTCGKSCSSMIKNNELTNPCNYKWNGREYKTYCLKCGAYWLKRKKIKCNCFKKVKLYKGEKLNIIPLNSLPPPPNDSW